MRAKEDAASRAVLGREPTLNVRSTDARVERSDNVEREIVERRV